MAGYNYKNLNLPEEKRFLGPASVMKRLFAFAIDLLIIFFLIAPPFLSPVEKSLPKTIDISSYNSILANKDTLFAFSMAFFFISMFSLLYFTIMDYKLGQTIGKMILNIYVVKLPQINPETGKRKNLKKLNEEEIKINIFSAMVRNLYVIPFFPFVILWILDPVYVMLNKNSQRFSEKLSGTMTVEVMSLGFSQN